MAELDELDKETIPIFINEPNYFRRFESSIDTKKPTQLSTTHWCREAVGFHTLALQFSASKCSVMRLITRPSRRAICTHCLAVCHETPSFDASILHASCRETCSARIRSSLKPIMLSLNFCLNFFDLVQSMLIYRTETKLNPLHYCRKQ